MGKFNSRNDDLFGGPLRTLMPTISANSTHIEDFKKYKEDLPYNWVRLGNNTNSHLDIYIQNKWIRMFENEKITLSDRNFDHLKIVTNSVAINEGDLVINVQKKGVDADSKARSDYIKENNPINKLLGAVRLIR